MNKPRIRIKASKLGVEKTFNSIREFANYAGVSPTTVRIYLSNSKKHRDTVDGWTFKAVTDDADRVCRKTLKQIIESGFTTEQILDMLEQYRKDRGL